MSLNESGMGSLEGRRLSRAQHLHGIVGGYIAVALRELEMPVEPYIPEDIMNSLRLTQEELTTVATDILRGGGPPDVCGVIPLDATRYVLTDFSRSEILVIRTLLLNKHYQLLEHHELTQNWYYLLQ